MAQYFLNRRQKNMVREISKGLDNRTIKPEWLYILGDDELVRIGESDKTGQLWVVRTSNLTIKKTDFDGFIEAGLFEYEGENKYTLNAQKVINTIKSDFGENQNTPIAKKTEPAFGEPSTHNEFKCDVFMIMPFAEEFNSIYQDYVKPTVEDLGLTIKRGDDFFSHHDIINEVWSAIYASQIVIADCTGRNPNVFYELGIAHTLGKIAILITQNIEDTPFDVQGKRFIVYKDNSAGLKQLRDKLKEYVSKAAKK